MFYSIQNTETGEYKVFALTTDQYNADQKLLSLVKYRPNQDGASCVCDFHGLPECPKHSYKPFAHVVGDTVKVFSRLMSDVDEQGRHLWVGYGGLFQVFIPFVEEVAKESYSFAPWFEAGKYKIYKATNCIRCGEWLTNPQSIEKGIGPVCEERI